MQYPTYAAGRYLLTPLSLLQASRFQINKHLYPKPNYTSFTYIESTSVGCKSCLQPYDPHTPLLSIMRQSLLFARHYNSEIDVGLQLCGDVKKGCILIRVTSKQIMLKIAAHTNSVMLGFTSRYWVHWDAKPKRSGRDIRFYVSVKMDGTG